MEGTLLKMILTDLRQGAFLFYFKKHCKKERVDWGSLRTSSRMMLPLENYVCYRLEMSFWI